MRASGRDSEILVQEASTAMDAEPNRMAYRIRHWGQGLFEHDRSNGRSNSGLRWVAVPTKHDGKGFLRIMRRDPTGGLYGMWILLLAVAAKCPTRGVLADEDGPLTAEDIAIKVGADTGSMQTAIEFLMSPEVGWVEAVDHVGPSVDQSGPTVDQSVRLQNSTEQYGTERNNRSVPSGQSEAGGAGKPASQSGRPKKGESAFAAMDSERLRNDGAVLDWVRWQSALPAPVIAKPTDEDRIRVLAAASLSLRKGKTPPAYFAGLVGHHRWERIPDEDLDKARQRLKERNGTV